MVQNGYGATLATCFFRSALNNVLFPAFGNPTIPIRKFISHVLGERGYMTRDAYFSFIINNNFFYYILNDFLFIRLKH
jgi:hypothetical protein